MNPNRLYQPNVLARANALYRQAVANTRGAQLLNPTSRLFAKSSLTQVSPPDAFAFASSAHTRHPGSIGRPSAGSRSGRESNRVLLADGKAVNNTIAQGSSSGHGQTALLTAPRSPTRARASSIQVGISTRPSVSNIDGSHIPTPASQSANINIPKNLARTEDDYWGRTTGALERVWDVSKNRFSSAWNPDDPVGLDTQTRIEQRRPGGYFHGPVGFANEVVFGPFIAAGDAVLRTGNGLLHAGAFGANQVASELGLISRRDKRLARDILGMAQMSFSRFARVPAATESARQTVQAARRAARYATTGLRPSAKAKGLIIDPRIQSPTKSASQISRQKQARHIFGTQEYKERLKTEKGSSSFFGKSSAGRLTLEAYKKGKFIPTKKKANVLHEFGVTTGAGSNGGMQSAVKVHIDKKGRIHGHPQGTERLKTHKKMEPSTTNTTKQGQAGQNRTGRGRFNYWMSLLKP